MHYLIQTTLAALESATVESFDGVQWIRQWHPQGGDLYIGHFPSGQALISGPIPIGNPNTPWFEIQCVDDAILTDIGAAQTLTMREAVRSKGPLRAWYKMSDRAKIRNSNPVGVLPAFVICGTYPAGSFLGDEDIDAAPELLDLD